tara:strand:+ start:137 stop:1321 length:1185 start_codon:yes stop_codon:yes gene_type:complete
MKKRISKGLFIGSLLPTKEKPEGGIFYLRLIDKLSKHLDEIYIIFPQKLSFKLKIISDYNLYKFSKIFKRPYFISLGFLRYFKSLYKYINLFSFLTFNYAVHRIYASDIKRKRLYPHFIYGHFIFPSGLAAANLSEKLNIPSVVAVGESSLDYLDNLPRKYLLNHLKKINIFISVNRKNSLTLQNKFLIPKNQIYILPNAVDEKIFFKRDFVKMRKELNLLFDKKYILFVGSLSFRKGFDMFLKLAKYSPEYNFIVIGRDTEKKAKDIKKIKNIKYLGIQTSEEVSKYMSACDLFTLYSRQEGSPNVLLEAKATGLPILCSNIDEHKELLNKEEAFFTKALKTNKIDNLDTIFNSNKYNSLSKQALKVKRNSLEIRAKKIFDIINKDIYKNIKN